MDFAHNPAGIKGLQKFINQLSYKTRTGILSGVGDRRDEDLREMGKLAAETFDNLIIRRGDYLRARTEENVINLLQEGTKESGKDIPVKIVHESKEAIDYAFENADAGDLIVILADTVSKDIEYVNQYRDQLSAR